MNLDVRAWVSKILSDIYAMQNKSCITACGNGSDISLTTSAKVIPMTTHRAKRGTDLTVVSNGVICEKDGIVAISAYAYFTTGYTANDIVHIVIRKGGTNILNWADRMVSTSYRYLGIPTIYQTVTAGTLIDLCAYNQTGARGLVANNTASALSVAYV